MALKKCKECGKSVSSSAKKCPHCGKEQQNWFLRHKVVTVILLSIIFSTFGLAGSGSSSKSEYSNTNQGAETQANKSAKEQVWTTVKTWKGSGVKKTEAFNITGKQWRINWVNKPSSSYPDVEGVVAIYVERPGGDFPVEVISSGEGKESDSSYIYKSGEFNLNITSANSNWTVEVQELK